MRQLIAALSRRLMPPTETLEGYQQPELVEVIFRKTLVYNPQEPWSEMAGALSVLDFGGGCGVHYKRANSPSVRWAVVETPAMVERAKEVATARLQFFTDIKEAIDWLGPIDVMHSDGALQYTTDPECELTELCALRARLMLWRRVNFSSSDVPEDEIDVSRLVLNGPGPAINIKDKLTRLDMKKVSKPFFLAAHHDYDLAESKLDYPRHGLYSFRFTKSEHRL